MPVEIRELIIRGVAAQDMGDDDMGDDDMDDASGDHQSEELEGTDKAKQVRSAPSAGETGEDRAALIQECVRHVLRILQQQKAR